MNVVEIQKVEERPAITHSLHFTGNWFIDTGILGFVNLMEEVYGWDFNKIVEEPIQKEKFYHAYFIYYIKKTAIDWINRQTLGKVEEDKKTRFNKMKKSLIRDINNTNFSFDTDAEKIRNNILGFNYSTKDMIRKNFREYESDVKKVFSNNKKTIFQKIDEIGIILNEPFFQNLNFLNPSKNKKGNEIEVLTSFESMVFKHKIKGDLTENALDKTISKFLFSEKEFHNIFYCKIQTIDDLEKMIKQPIITFLLSFPIAFNKIFDKHIVFYTNDIETSHHINKNIRIRVERAENKNSDILFRITWQNIIDYITEQRGTFSLENMYLIEYETIQRQDLIGVEYISIPKLQASILLDDAIRESLNKSVQFKSKKFKGTKYCWLLEEFIKGKSLYPIILNHINLFLNENIYLNWYLSLYSLIVDANILEFKVEKEKQNGSLFSENYFDSYKALTKKIKEDIQHTSFKASLIKEISRDEDKKERIARELLYALKTRDKNMFLNILFKNLNENKELCKNYNFNSWIFNKIISNNTSFEMYSLILVMNLI